MRIVLLGPPGSGKGTQSKLIAEKYNISQISIGDILRESIYANNKIGKIIKNTVKMGNLVSDNIVCCLVKERIKKKDCINGFLLDGFPRTIKQAQYISNNKIKIDYVIEFILPYQSILERLSGRRIHAPSGRIYHIKFNPPKIENKDDLTGQILITRDDDREESIKKRLEEYNKINHLLTEYYLKEKKIGNLNYFKINALDSLLNIEKKIELILNI